MRIWSVDPKLLSNRHLLGQHLELHSMLGTIAKHENEPEGQTKSGWWVHPETQRFVQAQDGMQWLYFTHEVMVVVMHRRWPQSGHADNHATPVPRLFPGLESMLELYKTLEDFSWTNMIAATSYPETRLAEGTPWERDGVSKAWYLEHQYDWSWKLVQQVTSEGGEFAKALVEEADNMTREAEVVTAGDGRPHLAAKETQV